MDDTVFQIFRKDTAVCPDHGIGIPYDPLGYDQITACLYGGRLYNAVYRDIACCPHAETAAHSAADMHIPHIVDVSRRIIYVVVNLQHRLYLKCLSHVFHMAGLGCQQLGAVFADLRILPLSKRRFFAVLGRNLLIQYRSARFPRCRQDCLTDHASRFYALEEMERRVVHPVVLIHFKLPFHDPFKMLNDPAVCSVASRFSFCQEKQRKIRIPFLRQALE